MLASNAREDYLDEIEGKVQIGEPDDYIPDMPITTSVWKKNTKVGIIMSIA